MKAVKAHIRQARQNPKILKRIKMANYEESQIPQWIGSERDQYKTRGPGKQTLEKQQKSPTEPGESTSTVSRNSELEMVSPTVVPQDSSKMQTVPQVVDITNENAEVPILQKSDDADLVQHPDGQILCKVSDERHGIKYVPVESKPDGGGMGSQISEITYRKFFLRQRAMRKYI